MLQGNLKGNILRVITCVIMLLTMLQYSPLRLLKKKSPALKDGEMPAKVGELMVEAGESPSHDNHLRCASAFLQTRERIPALVQQ